jgi:hypothetical protein
VDYFEEIACKILEEKGYWIRRSFKVELTKEEKRNIGKHSIPRPEIDILAYNQKSNVVIAVEAKSYFDSPGVRYEELIEDHIIPQGRYKLFTSNRYRSIVFGRLKRQLIDIGMISKDTVITLGLIAGNVYRRESEKIENYFMEKKPKWYFWGPEEVRGCVKQFSEMGYDNNPAVITAKILLT